jgi:hypothetical protein
MWPKIVPIFGESWHNVGESWELWRKSSAITHFWGDFGEDRSHSFQHAFGTIGGGMQIMVGYAC